MKYTVEESLRNFNFWSGGKERADMCSSSELDCIEEFLEEIEPEDGWDYVDWQTTNPYAERQCGEKK